MAHQLLRSLIAKYSISPLTKLHSLLLGIACALIIPSHKLFGAILALAFILSFFIVKIHHLKSLQKFDCIFLTTLAAYPAYVALSMLYHDINDTSIFDNPSRFLLITFVYLSLRTNTESIYSIVVGAAIGCLITFSESLAHVIQENTTRYSAHESPITFAQIALLLICIALTHWEINLKNYWAKRLYLLLILFIGLISVVASQSRGVLVAAPALIIFFMFFDKKLDCNLGERIFIAIFCPLMFVYFYQNANFYWLHNTPHELFSNIGSVDHSSSLGERLVLWASSIKLIMEKPLLGYGIGQFNLAINSLPSNLGAASQILSYSHAHNELLNAFVELGLLGPAILCSIFIGPAVVAIKSRFHYTSIYLLSCLGIGWFVFGLTQTQLAHQKITLFQLFILVVGFSYGMNKKYGSLSSQ